MSRYIPHVRLPGRCSGCRARVYWYAGRWRNPDGAPHTCRVAA
jgi:hypothetical protein